MELAEAKLSLENESDFDFEITADQLRFGLVDLPDDEKVDMHGHASISVKGNSDGVVPSNKKLIVGFTGDDKDFDFSEVGRQTLANTLKFPYGFFKKLPFTNQLSDLNVIKSQAQSPLRVYTKGDNVVRIEDANRYTFDTLKLVEFLEHLTSDGDIEIQNFGFDKVTQKIHCKVLRMDEFEVGSGDNYRFGYDLWGGGQPNIKMDDGLYRLVCSNGMVVQDKSFRHGYNIKCKDLGNSEVYNMLQEILYSDKKHLIESLQSKLRASQQISVNKDTVEMLMDVFSGMGFVPKGSCKSVIKRFEEEDLSLYGFINSITWVAKSANPTNRNCLEKFAGFLTDRGELINV